jgi:hypothetical protein
MSFQSLKQLLLRKTNNEELDRYIELLGNSGFMSFVSESLNKMASNKNNDANNHAMNWYAKHSLPTHTDMYRDALGHHTSHYKAALESGNKELADKHMSQAMRLLNFGSRMGSHSYTDHNGDHVEGGDKLNLDAVPDQPWQKWSQQQPKGNFGVILKKPSEKSNYDHLRGSPHGHKDYAMEIDGHRKRGNDFTSGWPAEQTKVNGKYIDVDHELESPGEYKEHAFDSHPVLDYYSKPQAKMTDEDHANFIDKAVKWHSPDNKKVNDWFDAQDAKPMSDGSTASAPVHPELADYNEESGEEHNPQKHKMRLDHALENQSLYYSPTTNKGKKNAKAMARVRQASGAAPEEATQTTSSTPSGMTAKDQKIVDNLKGIEKLPEHIQRITLNNQPDHIVEAAGHTALKEKLNA